MPYHAADTDSPFSGQESELVTTSLRGFRAWKAYSSSLRAVSSEYAWAPGINVARCYSIDPLINPLLNPSRPHVHTGPDNTFVPVFPVRVPVFPVRTPPSPSLYYVSNNGVIFSLTDLCSDNCLEHEAPGKYCSCGFYGWYEPSPSNFTQFSGPVIGVTENTGRIILGSKGFRAQKSKIVAVALNPEPPLYHLYERQHIIALKEIAANYKVQFFDLSTEMIETYPSDKDVLTSLGVTI